MAATDFLVQNAAIAFTAEDILNISTLSDAAKQVLGPLLSDLPGIIQQSEAGKYVGQYAIAYMDRLTMIDGDLSNYLFDLAAGPQTAADKAKVQADCTQLSNILADDTPGGLNLLPPGAPAPTEALPPNPVSRGPEDGYQQTDEKLAAGISGLYTSYQNSDPEFQAAVPQSVVDTFLAMGTAASTDAPVCAYNGNELLHSIMAVQSTAASFSADQTPAAQEALANSVSTALDEWSADTGVAYPDPQPNTAPPPPTVPSDPQNPNSPQIDLGTPDFGKAGEKAATEAALSVLQNGTTDPNIVSTIADGVSKVNDYSKAIEQVADAAAVGQQLTKVATDYTKADPKLGSDIQQLTMTLGGVIGKNTAQGLAVTEEVGGAAALQPEIVALGVIQMEAGKQVGGAAGKAGGWIVGGMIKGWIDQSPLNPANQKPFIGPPKPPAIPNPIPNSSANALSGTVDALTAVPARQLLFLTVGPVANTKSYVDATGTLKFVTAITGPANPTISTPLHETQFVIDSHATYPITADTIAADIANVYLTFINNGNAGVAGNDETMKLATDTTVNNPALFKSALGLVEIATSLGKLLGGDATDANYITQIVQMDLAAPLPAGVTNAVDNYINRSVFGAPSDRGSVLLYLNDIAHGKTQLAAFQDVTGTSPHA